MEIKNFIVGDLVTNCYLVSSGSEAIIIDPGAEARKLWQEVENISAKLKYIVLTHYHPDHALGAQELKDLSGALILAHEGEKDFLEFEADQWLKEGEEITIGEEKLQVINTPGHTKGSICLLGDHFIFTGDLLFVDGYGRTDLPGGSEKEIKDSLERVSGIIKPGMKIYPGHGEIFETINGVNGDK